MGRAQLGEQLEDRLDARLRLLGPVQVAAARLEQRARDQRVGRREGVDARLEAAEEGGGRQQLELDELAQVARVVQAQLEVGRPVALGELVELLLEQVGVRVRVRVGVGVRVRGWGWG